MYFPFYLFTAVWGKGSGQPHLPPAPFPAQPTSSTHGHQSCTSGRCCPPFECSGERPRSDDIEGKKPPFKESRCFPHSHKFPWRRQDLMSKTRQTQTPLSSPLRAHDLMAPICPSSFPFSGSLQPLLLCAFPFALSRCLAEALLTPPSTA